MAGYTQNEGNNECEGGLSPWRESQSEKERRELTSPIQQCEEERVGKEEEKEE